MLCLYLCFWVLFVIFYCEVKYLCNLGLSNICSSPSYKYNAGSSFHFLSWLFPSFILSLSSLKYPQPIFPFRNNIVQRHQCWTSPQFLHVANRTLVDWHVSQQSNTRPQSSSDLRRPASLYSLGETTSALDQILSLQQSSTMESTHGLDAFFEILREPFLLPEHNMYIYISNPER